MLDTCVLIDLPGIEPDLLPRAAAISSLVVAELAQGVAMSRDPVAVQLRSQRLSDVEGEFAVIPFDREAARRYGTLVAMTIRAGRDSRPHKTDLMIAATAAAHGLPLYTRNIKDFKGLESAVTVVEV
jgi:toxin FitB